MVRLRPSLQLSCSSGRVEQKGSVTRTWVGETLLAASVAVEVMVAAEQALVVEVVVQALALKLQVLGRMHLQEVTAWMWPALHARAALLKLVLQALQTECWHSLGIAYVLSLGSAPCALVTWVLLLLAKRCLSLKADCQLSTMLESTALVLQTGPLLLETCLEPWSLVERRLGSV